LPNLVKYCVCFLSRLFVLVFWVLLCYIFLSGWVPQLVVAKVRATLYSTASITHIIELRLPHLHISSPISPFFFSLLYLTKLDLGPYPLLLLLLPPLLPLPPSSTTTLYPAYPHFPLFRPLIPFFQNPFKLSVTYSTRIEEPCDRINVARQPVRQKLEVL